MTWQSGNGKERKYDSRILYYSYRDSRNLRFILDNILPNVIHCVQTCPFVRAVEWLCIFIAISLLSGIIFAKILALVKKRNKKDMLVSQIGFLWLASILKQF